jgi:hypothetical protein
MQKGVLALYYTTSGGGAFFNPAFVLQFGASGGGKVSTARGILLQHGRSVVYSAEI